VGYCKKDPITGDTVMDVPGPGHIDVAGYFYRPENQPESLNPEGEMEPDPENIVWEPGFHLNVVFKGQENQIPTLLKTYKLKTPESPNILSHL
jgi:hypothetical protein